MDAHTDAARYHVHGQKKPDDAGKPGAWKARTPGLEGAGQKKEQLCHLRWLATLPRSPLRAKKNARDRLMAWASTQPSWAIGFLDEVWWSRFALPSLNVWQSKDEPVHLVEQVWQKNDPDPKAFACYGVLWQHGPVTSPVRHQMSLRFVDGRPISAITTQFLEWICTRLQEQGKRSWLLIWDNASWHYSKQVRTWIREQNQKVK
jgi:hypothetical protein